MSARWFALLGLTLCAGILSALALGGEAQVRGAVATPPTVPRLDPAPFTPRQAFAEPPVVSSRNGRLTTTLVARNGTVSVGGLDVANTQTYSAETAAGATMRWILGPTLRVRPGDTIDLTLDNQLLKPDNSPTPADPAPDCSKPEGHAGHESSPLPNGGQYTNLHFHGLHVTPTTRKVDGETVFGDNVLLNLPPGKSRFEFDLPADHPEGTYWYHAHRHMCTDDQVYRGLAGLLLIGDSRRALPRRFRHIRARSLALKDVQVARKDSTSPWAIPGSHDWTVGTHRTVNGFVNPLMRIRPGETQLWRVANTSAALWYRVALVDEVRDVRERLQIVAQDGNPLVRPVSVRDVVIPPGHRLDMLVRGQRSGERVLKTLRFNQGRRVFGEDDLATLTVEKGRAKRLAAAKPRGRLPAFPTRRGPARRFEFSIDAVGNNVAFEINGKVFDPDRVDADPTLGTVERWTLINNSSEWHPFHIHQDDFRIVSINGRRPSPVDRGERDIVALPPMGPRGPGEVVIDMPFTDFAGKFVFHCHILDHEDGGMMALVNVKRR